MNEHIEQPTMEGNSNETLAIDEVLKSIEKKVKENRTKFNDGEKTLKDFRRIFDQDSSRMNQAIFNDSPSEETYLQTLRTVSSLIEILTRTGKHSTPK